MAAVVSFAGQSALAHSVSKVSPGYAGDTHGLVWTNSSGDCVRTSSWNKDMATAGCDAGLMPKPAKAAPAPAPVIATAPVAKPAPVPMPAIERINLKADALFDVNKADLKPKGKSELDVIASRVTERNFKLEQITVTGHADSTGASAPNQALSERRAAAVKTYLVQRGVAPEVIVTQGMGEDQPVASNATAEGRAQNRRVELDIKGQKQ
ncbi:MAG: OmpA family protein [Gammaproteobacteria bacterium]|nr:OmpA family protein [Gammaproteobacteria bacterium]